MVTRERMSWSRLKKLFKENLIILYRTFVHSLGSLMVCGQKLAIKIKTKTYIFCRTSDVICFLPKETMSRDFFIIFFNF